LVECLYSIKTNINNANYEVILIDDNSPDIRIKEAFEGRRDIKYIRNEENLGFIKTVNKGVRLARGKYILLLNSDVQLLNDVVNIFKDALNTYPEVGIVGPKVIFPDGILQEAGCSIKPNGSIEMIGHGDSPEDPKYNFRRYVDYISGACWFFEKELFEKLNGFDECFAPAYAEDVDFCLRVIKHNKKILYCPEAVIVHHMSKSSEEKTSLYKYYFSARNRLKVKNKHGNFLKDYSRVKAIAFYLPQFHEIEQNNYWWGKNYTEWRAAATAKPQFKSHYQPHIPADLGFYDLTNPEVFEKQAQLAKRYGIYGFCFYYYNFGHFELLEKALDAFLKSNADIKFCLCWANENWTRRWDGMDKEVLVEQKATDNDEIFLKVLKDMTRFIKDKRYIRIDGKPLILIYRPSLFTNIKDKLKLWRNYWKDRYGEDLYLCAVDSMERASGNAPPPEELGFDAAVEFPVHGIHTRSTLEEEELLPDSNFNGIVVNYLDAVTEICSRKHPGYKRFPGVFPSWDNTPRRKNKGTVFINTHPSAFQVYLECKVEEALLLSGSERFLFINAWNEWGEGNHLEPDLKYGHSWLQVVDKVLKEV